MGKHGRQAIITKAFGCVFRSRLEVRIACLFNALGIRWEYEPYYYKLTKKLMYKPDFLCSYRGVKFFLEVKPKRPKKIEVAKAQGLARVEGLPVLLTVSNPFYEKILFAHHYYLDAHGRCCSDFGKFTEFIGMTYLDYTRAVNEARDSYRQIVGSDGREAG